LHHTQALAHVGEYAQAMHTLKINTHVAPSTETIVAICHLHPLAKVDLTPFVHDFHLETDIGLDQKNIYFCFDTFITSFI
jgi:hypothetical protein